MSGISRVISYLTTFRILPTDTSPEVEAAVVGLEELEEPESGKKGFNEILYLLLNYEIICKTEN